MYCMLHITKSICLLCQLVIIINGYLQGLIKRYHCPLKSYTIKSMMLWCLESSRFSIGFWSDADNIVGLPKAKI